jgi:hypothetical protein
MMMSCQALLRWCIFLLGPPPPSCAYPQWWVQLLYLSLLAMVSDWVCFLMVFVLQAYTWAYPGRTSKGLIELFLAMNIVICLVFTDPVSRFGLRNCVRVGSVPMTAGCWLRCRFGAMIPPLGLRHQRRRPCPNDLSTTRRDNGGSAGPVDRRGLLPPYPVMAHGTAPVGLSQPFFQCTPPLLSATWFPPGERATSSMVALNFNQVGIATALVVGGWMVNKGGGGEQDNNHHRNNASSARVGRDGNDHNLLAINGHSWEEWYCCINSVTRRGGGEPRRQSR